MPKEIYKLITYDSEEEIQFVKWLELAQEAGLVERCVYQPGSYLLSDKVQYTEEVELKTKTKTVHKTLFHPHEYTADFLIYFNKIFFQFFPGLLRPAHKDTKTAVVVDVKGLYNQNDAWRRFSIDQKWVYQIYGVYVNKVIPEQFFSFTFVPDEIAWIKGRKKPTRIKRFSKCKLFSEVENTF
ncbi:MAG: hypothetical protein KKA84_11965 [Bacteroidetes bacterium]|nr:hypothetical protein [Bacteroidota bacterium]